MSSLIISCINCGSFNHHILVRSRNYESYNFDFLDKYLHIVVCKNCGLTFINPQGSEDDYQRYYRESGNREGAVRASKEQMLEKKKYQKLSAKWLAGKIKPRKDMKVLDVGCGLGTFLFWLKELGFEKVEGLELLKPAATFAQEKLRIPVHVEDLFGSSLGREQFDLVTSVATLEHFTDPLAALKKMNELLKPGAFLYVDVPDLYGMSLKTGVSGYFKFVHTYYYTEKTLRSLLSQAGFRAKHIWRMPQVNKYATYLYPDNRLCGELHVIAQKCDVSKEEKIERENYADIVKFFQKTKRQDCVYALCHRLTWNKYTGPLLRKLRKHARKEYVYKDLLI